MARSSFPPDPTVRSLLDDRVRTGRTYGIVVGLLDDDGSRTVLASGESDLPGVGLDGSTVFEIGSITKAFTGILLADMALRAEVELEAPVARYLPADVAVPSSNGRAITLLDLATHTSGLPGMPDNFEPRDPANPYADYSTARLYDFLARYILTREPGAGYEYSNLGSGLLGHALARVAGTDYESLLIERVLDRVTMADTRITLGPDLARRFTPGHHPTGTVAPSWDFLELGPAGALRSTVNDMLQFLAANLDPAGHSLGSALSLSHESRRDAGQPGMSVGLGWHILRTTVGPIVRHNGGTYGARSFAGFSPTRHRGVVVLTNSALGSDDIGFHLLDPEQPLAEPPRQRTAREIDPALLPRYVGVYQIAPPFHLTVTFEDGSLWIQATGQGKAKLHPKSETSFFVAEVDAEITYTVKPGDRVTGLVLRQSGATLSADHIG